MDFKKAAALTFANICLLRGAHSATDIAALFEGFRHAYGAGIEYLNYFEDRFDIDLSPASEPAPTNKTAESNQPNSMPHTITIQEAMLEAIEERCYGIDDLASIATPKYEEKAASTEQPITRITVELPGAHEAEIVKAFAEEHTPALATRFAVLNQNANIKVEYINIP